MFSRKPTSQTYHLARKMSDKSNNLVSEIDSKLQLLDGLLHEKRFKEALAEIRDLEATQKLDEGTLYFGHFCYYSAEVFRKLGDYQTALTKASKAFEIFKNTNENKRIAQIKYTLGNIYIALGDLKNAQEELHESLVTYKRIDDDRGRISVLCMLANISFQQSNYQIAIEYLLDSIKLCDKIGETQIKARGLGNLGTIYLRIGNLRLAEQNLLLNTKINEESNDWLNYCKGLLVLGYVCSQQRDFKRANKYFEQALKLIFENNYAREFAIYNEYAGELEFAQGNYDEARNHYLNCIGAMEIIAPEGDMISQTYRLLAELQIAEKRYDEALTSCEKAMKVAESLGEKIEIGAIHRALGQIYTALKQNEKAKENFGKSISILQEIGAKFELGKAYLEALRSSAFEYIDRMFYYGNAKDTFQELESDYWLGTSALSFCEMLLEYGEYGKADVYLKDAEKPFKRAKENKGLESVAELRSKIDKALGRVGSPDSPHRAVYLFSDIITQDQKMFDLIKEAQRLKDMDMPILIEGETGTGKDLLAMAIHCESKRKNKPFVPVSCPSISENLIESELFGHKKGAFTGADKDKMGLFEAANGGTIFLNEIGDFPLKLQAKILDVIENKRLTRVGDIQSRNLDFRVIAATNRNLKEEMKKGYFREDLYHRLNCASFKLPPLRERKKDIPLLIKHFLTEQGIVCEDLDKLSDMQDCLGYHWPGNVRQLENELKRVISILNPFDPQKLLEELSRSNKTEDQSNCGDSLSDKKAGLEKTEILEALKKFNNDKEKAAKFLGISKITLYRKMKAQNLEK